MTTYYKAIIYIWNNRHKYWELYKTLPIGREGLEKAYPTREAAKEAAENMLMFFPKEAKFKTKIVSIHSSLY
jgi:hypothetical protein